MTAEGVGEALNVSADFSLGEGRRSAKELADGARRMAALRSMRSEYLPSEIFGEPAWDILLDLYIASLESKPISVSSACIASGVPATTALRWLARLEQLGLVERVDDRNDRRRVYVRITEWANRAIDAWINTVLSTG